MLAGDKQKYTAEMRRAKGPNHPRGGSTKVNGQQPKTIQANIAAHMDIDNASQHDTDEDEDWEPNDTETAFDETAVFLANVLRDV